MTDDANEYHRDLYLDRTDISIDDKDDKVRSLRLLSKLLNANVDREDVLRMVLYRLI